MSWSPALPVPPAETRGCVVRARAYMICDGWLHGCLANKSVFTLVKMRVFQAVISCLQGKSTNKASMVWCRRQLKYPRSPTWLSTLGTCRQLPAVLFQIFGYPDRAGLALQVQIQAAPPLLKIAAVTKGRLGDGDMMMTAASYTHDFLFMSIYFS